jgi:hypothetical protein
MGLFCRGGRCGLGRLNPPQLPIRRERGGGYLSGGSWMGICRPGGGVGGEATAGEKGGGRQGGCSLDDVPAGRDGACAKGAGAVGTAVGFEGGHSGFRTELRTRVGS